MPSITVKNIPDDLYARLRAAARTHRRSINSELISCLEVVLKPRPISAEERLERVRRLRSSIEPAAISAEDIQQAIDSERA